MTNVLLNVVSDLKQNRDHRKGSLILMDRKNEMSKDLCTGVAKGIRNGTGYVLFYPFFFIEFVVHDISVKIMFFSSRTCANKSSFLKFSFLQR